MDFMTTKEAAGKWNLTERMVQYRCKTGRIEGAVKVEAMWLIPKDAQKPIDSRYKANKVKDGINK